MKWILSVFVLFICLSCDDKQPETPKKTSFEASNTLRKKHTDFNAYWYDGFAEITSYKLEQVRYGEIHSGTSTLIYVTEPFLPEKQVKADYQNDDNISVLKLNKTKKFLTGIYPYSLMTSTFSPIKTDNHAIKISFSSQEWCGNTFVQLNNKEDFEIDFKSYFESNSDKKLSLKKEWLEDDIWTVLRISPENLPTGNLNMVPSFEYLALYHKEIKVYKVDASLVKSEENSNYILSYPELQRELKIVFSNQFPFQIERWEETVTTGANKQTTSATKMQSIKSKYWSKNKKQDTIIRQELNL